MRTTSSGLVMAMVLGALAAPVAAQDEAPATDDPIFSSLFPPELIMQHRRAIDLTDDQRDDISRLIGDLQGRVVQLQWDLLDEMQRLEEITARPRIDLDQALDQLETVLDRENEIKVAHLEMLVRIKNLLRPDQQAALEELRPRPGG